MNTTTARLLAAIIIGQATKNIDAGYLAALTLWTDSFTV